MDIEYTLTLDDGSTVQTNVGGPPLAFVAGEGQIIPGLEAALQGKAAHDRVKVRIAPEQAYGPWIQRRCRKFRSTRSRRMRARWAHC